MNDLNKLLSQNLYSLDTFKKELFFNKYLNQLTLHHYKNSKSYNKILKSFGFNKKKKLYFK